jgi:hypothetical protein
VVAGWAGGARPEGDVPYGRVFRDSRADPRVVAGRDRDPPPLEISRRLCPCRVNERPLPRCAIDGSCNGEAGQILAGGNQRSAVVYGSGGSPIYAHENVLTRLTQAGGDSAAWPTDTYFVAQKDMFFNGEPVQLMHVPSAHSDGDSLVVFRRTDVISVGNIYTPGRYPIIDVDRGGTIDGIVSALNRVIELTVPEFNEQGGTMVVPGRGHLADEADVAEYRDMVTIVRDRVRDMVNKGMTLEQVKASKPTADYDVVYGEREGQTFIEAAYRTLPPPKPASPPTRGKPSGGTK